MVKSITFDQENVITGAPSALQIKVAVLPFSLAAFAYCRDWSICGGSIQKRQKQAMDIIPTVLRVI